MATESGTRVDPISVVAGSRRHQLQSLGFRV